MVPAEGLPLMYAPTKPNSFRRSTERQVGDPNERLVVEEDRRRNRALLEFEAIGGSAAAASVLVEPVTLERATTDHQLYDLEGRVYP